MINHLIQFANILDQGGNPAWASRLDDIIKKEASDAYSSPKDVEYNALPFVVSLHHEDSTSVSGEKPVLTMSDSEALRLRGKAFEHGSFFQRFSESLDENIASMLRSGDSIDPRVSSIKAHLDSIGESIHNLNMQLDHISSNASES